jgi:hypothetical protein
MDARQRLIHGAFGAGVAAMLAVLLAFGPASGADKKITLAKQPANGKPATVGKQLGYIELANLIDNAIDERLKEEKVMPSAAADDAEFLRRVYLDIVGHIPTAEKAAAFLDSKDANKRGKLVDELLDSPDYGRHMADLWQTLLLPRNSDNRRLQTEPLEKWLEDAFNKDQPWNMMVHDLLTATGEQDKNGAVTYFVANPTVDKITDNVTKVFLGVQLQCAQCHNHPFTEWKQTEYWGMAAFFMKVESTPAQMAAKNGTSPVVKESDKPRRGKNALPDSAKNLPPKFLGGPEPKVNKSEALRPVLADWITTPENPYFARAMVNRLWAQFMGRGLVNPVDDMHDGNPASHPELMADLAEQFAAGNNFDVKYMIRAICNSKSYQHSGKPTPQNAEAGPELYARSAIKVLSPEQLFDSLRLALSNGRAPVDPAPAKGPRGNNVSQRKQFVLFFETEDGADPTEYQAGIPQALRLMNAPQLNNSQAVLALLKGKTQEQAVDQLYLATLSRRPTAKERDMVERLMKKEEPGKVYADVLWAVLNSSEFTLNK